MHVAIQAARIRQEFHGALEIAIGPAAASLQDLIAQLSDIECSAQDLAPEMRSISTAEARLLVSATLQKGMAYSNEYMSTARASTLATTFISSFRSEARFSSPTCIPDDYTQTVGGRYFNVSTHTFESALLGRGEHESAFFLAIDED